MAKEKIVPEETPEARPERKSDKPKGWHSRRHPDRSAHDASRQCYQAEHGPAARRVKAAIRDAEAAKRTPEEQLARLGGRPGNSTKERQRLIGKINDTLHAELAEATA